MLAIGEVRVGAKLSDRRPSVHAPFQDRQYQV